MSSLPPPFLIDQPQQSTAALNPTQKALEEFKSVLPEIINKNSQIGKNFTARKNFQRFLAHYDNKASSKIMNLISLSTSSYLKMRSGNSLKNVIPGVERRLKDFSSNLLNEKLFDMNDLLKQKKKFFVESSDNEDIDELKSVLRNLKHVSLCKSNKNEQLFKEIEKRQQDAKLKEVDTKKLCSRSKSIILKKIKDEEKEFDNRIEDYKKRLTPENLTENKGYVMSKNELNFSNNLKMLSYVKYKPVKRYTFDSFEDQFKKYSYKNNKSPGKFQDTVELLMKEANKKTSYKDKINVFNNKINKLIDNQIPNYNIYEEIIRNNCMKTFQNIYGQPNKSYNYNINNIKDNCKKEINNSFDNANDYDCLYDNDILIRKYQLALKNSFDKFTEETNKMFNHYTQSLKQNFNEQKGELKAEDFYSDVIGKGGESIIKKNLQKENEFKRKSESMKNIFTTGLKTSIRPKKKYYQ